jgi:RimJ/RimL family protein N-acetyltransferase
MEKDFIIENFTPPPHPKIIQLNGRTVRLEPLDALKHAEDLFQSNSFDREGMNWKYLPYGPFEKIEDYANWLQEKAKSDDPSFFAIIRLSDHKAVGIASFLRINPTDGSIEVGHINYSPLLQKTREGTEAMYLMMKWVFESGYRRYEWKCNALNAKSRYAAQRLGFSYEGVFRQMAINKGKNRNTAWFAAIDKEWNALKESYEIYLSDDNFDIEQKPKRSLSDLTKPILYKRDNKEFG